MLTKFKIFSMVTILPTLGLITVLFFTGSGSSTFQLNTYEIIPIDFSENLKRLVFGTNDSNIYEKDIMQTGTLDSCIMADILIGKKGISQCDV